METLAAAAIELVVLMNDGERQWVVGWLLGKTKVGRQLGKTAEYHVRTIMISQKMVPSTVVTVKE